MAEDITKRIIVRLEAQEAGLTQKLKEVGNNMLRTAEIFERGYLSQKHYARAMRINRDEAAALRIKLAAVRAELRRIRQATAQSQAVFGRLWGRMLGFSLSMMFFGMQIKRVFSRIASISIDTFMKIAGSTDLAKRVFVSLTAALTFLKFTIGDAIARALEPFMPMIIGIIETVTDWIYKNQKLAGILIIVGLLIGALMMVLGQVMTFINGIIGILPKFRSGLTGLQPAVSGLIGFFTQLGIVGSLIFGVVLISALAMFIQNFMGVRDDLKKLFESLMGIFSGFADVFVGLLTGNYEQFVRGVKKILAYGLQLLVTFAKLAVKLLIGIPMMLARILGYAVRLIVSALMSALSAMADIVADFLEQFSNLPIVGGLFAGAARMARGAAEWLSGSIAGFNRLMEKADENIKNWATGIGKALDNAADFVMTITGAKKAIEEFNKEAQKTQQNLSTATRPLAGFGAFRTGGLAGTVNNVTVNINNVPPAGVFRPEETLDPAVLEAFRTFQKERDKITGGVYTFTGR